MVIVAEERASRPNQFDIESGAEPVCPFCEGNESMTPGEITAFRKNKPDLPGWTARTVPNLYPAVVRSVEDFSVDASQWTSSPAVGTHEVIVDTPRHILSVAEMTGSEVETMFGMYAARLRALRSEGRFVSVMIFKNVGQAAGASLQHSHSQLIALPFIPESLRSELDHAATYEECPWCDMLQAEFQSGVRIVEETERFVALCPFVSRFPAEVAVWPKRHKQYFDELSDDELAEYARLLRRTIRRLEKSVPWIKCRLAYNVILSTAPLLREEFRQYHLRFSILPSLSRAAGFEWGTGLHINPISPETAAARLRAAKAE